MAGIFGTSDLPKKKVKKKKKDLKLGTGMAEDARKVLKGRGKSIKDKLKEMGI